MKQSAILVFLSMFFLFSIVNGFSQDSNLDQSRIIDIKIDGLKRTQQGTAEEPLQQFLGMNAESINIDDVKAAILGLGILDPLEVTIEDAEDGSGKLLCVSVHEKWSIIPVPAFSINTAGYEIGLALLDNNAFGLNDKFILGGMFGTAGWMAASSFVHQGKKGVPGWTAAAMYSSGALEYHNQKGENIRFFLIDSLTLMAGISYDFNELISSEANISFYMGDVSQDAASFAVPDDVNYLSARITSDLVKDSWDGYFISQKSLSALFEYSYGFDAPSYYSLQLHGLFEQSLFPGLIPGLKALLRGSVIYAPDAPPLREYAASSANIDILSGSFTANTILGGSAGLEKSIYRFSFGTLSAFASYQLAYSEGPILGGNFDHGVLGGIRFYMSKLAMPALGLGASYNVAASSFQAYFNLGITF